VEKEKGRTAPRKKRKRLRDVGTAKIGRWASGAQAAEKVFKRVIGNAI
jgi:hypothetical protein